MKTITVKIFVEDDKLNIRIDNNVKDDDDGESLEVKVAAFFLNMLGHFIHNIGPNKPEKEG